MCATGIFRTCSALHFTFSIFADRNTNEDTFCQFLKSRKSKRTEFCMTVAGGKYECEYECGCECEYECDTQRANAYSLNAMPLLYEFGVQTRGKLKCCILLG